MATQRVGLPTSCADARSSRLLASARQHADLRLRAELVHELQAHSKIRSPRISCGSCGKRLSAASDS